MGGRAERMVKEVQVREEQKRKRREAIEAQTQQLLAERDAIRSKNDQTRLQLQSDVALVDQSMEDTLRGTNENLWSLRAEASGEVRAILDGLSAENSRVWSLEDHKSFAR